MKSWVAPLLSVIVLDSRRKLAANFEVWLDSTFLFHCPSSGKIVPIFVSTKFSRIFREKNFEDHAAHRKWLRSFVDSWRNALTWRFLEIFVLFFYKTRWFLWRAGWRRVDEDSFGILERDSKYTRKFNTFFYFFLISRIVKKKKTNIREDL